MQPFVKSIFPQHVAIANPPRDLAHEFPELAIAQAPAEARLPYSRQEELADILTRLQLLAVPFLAAGPGWHPAAVFEHLRSQQAVAGSIPTIVWLGPDKTEFGEV